MIRGVPLRLFLPLLLLAGLPACRTAAPQLLASRAAVPSELTETAYLFEVVRYLYRWQLTEAEVERLVGSETVAFWVQRLDVPLDPGDSSVLGEIMLPLLGLRVKVKKTECRIDELGAEVKSRNFRIVQVVREALPARPPPSAHVVGVDMKAMRDYLFRTRAQHDYPDEALVKRLQQAVRNQASRELIVSNSEPGAEVVVHIAPLSPVANEVWVFWEAGRKLFLFASDIDLANPAIWEHETLLSRIYDLDQQVIVTPEEAPGSTCFLTRYQVSRAMFNCVLFGQRTVVRPPAPADSKRTN